MFAIGGALTIAGGADLFDSDAGFLLGCSAGPILVVGGIITTTSCLVRAKNLKKKASPFSVSSAPLFQQDFKLKNGTTLSPSLDILKDNTQRNTTFGVGLTYNF